MKGWLSSREGNFPFRVERYFYRLQWGFLSRHLTESSAACAKYFVHGAAITTAKSGFKVFVDLGHFGIMYANESTTEPPRRILLAADNAQSFHTWVTCLSRARSRSIASWYHIGQSIGQGSDASVFLGTSKGVGRKNVAIKRVRLVPNRNGEGVGLKLHRMLKEIQLQCKAARHSTNIADVLDVFFDSEYCFIVVEYGNKGSLSQLLESRNGKLPEKIVKNIMLQLGRCVLSLHQNDIVHRDIKCDNVVLRQTESTPLRVLLCDFGYASVWRPEVQHSMNSFCRGLMGTERYLAPEIVRGDLYGAPSDIFSLGVLCHVCLTGIFPFNSNGPNGVQYSVHGELGDLERCRTVSRDAVSFCKGLLNKDWKKRLTAVALLQHKWLRGRAVTTMPRRRPSATVHSSVIFRRIFHVLSAVRTLQRLQLDSRRRYAIDTGFAREWGSSLLELRSRDRQGEGVAGGDSVHFRDRSSMSDDVGRVCIHPVLRCLIRK